MRKMEEKKSELLIKISVDTTELDAAIEKIKLLNSLYQEKNIMKILSTAQQTKERLKEIDVDQFANELVNRLKNSLDLSSRILEE